ncbi:MAG: hypothetical protein LBS91_02975 [Clostridiales Family XIII bacterium]|jgi:hypothetical protein|nr:hypothetical protein [Clostridiales Family XIII bacterium]
MAYTPKPFNTAMTCRPPTVTHAKGVEKKAYGDEEALSKAFGIFGSFSSYGGTEQSVNGVFAVEDTAVVETWYRPDVTAACRIDVAGAGEYEIVTPPENINMRGVYLRFKVRALTGGA